jgi:acetyl esterase/lipase
MKLTIPLVGALVWRLCLAAEAPAQRPRQSAESRPAAGRVSREAQPEEGGYPAFILPADVEMKKDILFGRGGERELRGDLFVPKDKRRHGPMPAIVYIHGGGWRVGSRSFMHRMAAHLAQRGIAGLAIEYRLSDVAIYPAQIHDCKAAIRWMRANAKDLRIASDRIGVLGDSAGAHLAAMLATTADAPEFEGNGGNPGISTKVQAAVLFYGVYDLRALARSNLSGLAKMFLGATLDEAPGLYERASPINHVSSATPPSLVLYGDRDSPLVTEGSRGFAEALRKAGVSVTVEVAKGQEHSYALTAKDLAPPMRPVEAFLAKCFGMGDRSPGKTKSDASGN